MSPTYHRDHISKGTLIALIIVPIVLMVIAILGIVFYMKSRKKYFTAGGGRGPMMRYGGISPYIVANSTDPPPYGDRHIDLLVSPNEMSGEKGRVQDAGGSSANI